MASRRPARPFRASAAQLDGRLFVFDGAERERVPAGLRCAIDDVNIRIERVQHLAKPASAAGPLHSTARRPLAGSFDGDTMPTEISTVWPAVNSTTRE